MIEAEKIVYLTEKQAQFLDHLLWKESQAKRKRGIHFVDTDYDEFVDLLKNKIVDQSGIEFSSDQLEYMNKTQSE
jgi:hypothetical protein